MPTGPRSQQQLDGNRWPARDTQQRQSSTSALPTGPSADRTRQRGAAQPSGRPSGRDASSLPSGPKQTRGDSGWPTREPVGPPADLDRASSSGFRGPPPPRDFPASRGREFDYDDRRYPRSDRSAGNREPEASYREAPPLRDSRGPPRELRDEGWSRRSAPQESYATDRERVSRLPRTYSSRC